MDRTHSPINSILEQAAYIARRKKETAGTLEPTESYKRGQTIELIDFANSNNLWISLSELNVEFLSKGGENEVYTGNKDNIVIKLNNFEYAGDDLENFFIRINAHNKLFGNVPYQMIGFAYNSQQEFCAVLIQPYILAEREATEDEIATANANPKVGDMAYVISTKRAYIYKGVDALSAKAVPQGWVVFDEITSELDLVNYLKKSEAEATYRKLSAKIAESDLATELVNKIDAKADKSYVDGELAGKTDEAYVNSKVEEVVAPVRTESAQNKANITKEVEDRKAEITRVEGVITSSVNAAKQELTSSLTEKETALKAEDTRLNNRINKFVPVVAEEEPTETEEGHVWLQLV